MPGPLAEAYRPNARYARARHDAPVEGPFEAAETSVETAVLGRILWARKTTILATSAAFTILALLYCLITPPQYSASAQILVDPRDKQVVANDVNPSGVAPDGGVTQVESQVSVVQSSGVLLRAIAATDLEADPEYNGVGSGMFSRVASLLSLLSSHSLDGAENDLKARTLNNLRKRLTVKRADKVLVVDLAVTSRDPDKAARIANAIADAYLADQAQARSDAGRQASKSLTDRLSELQNRVRDAENAVEDYRAQNKLVVSTGQLVNDQQLNELTAQLSAAQNRAATLRAQLDSQTRNPQGADATPEALQSAVVGKLRDRESALVEKLASLGDKLGPLHPEFTGAKTELAHVRELISRELRRVGRSTRADYERAVADERALSAKLEQFKNRSLDDDKADVRLHELQRQLEAVKTVYSNFLVRAKETNELAGVDSTNARIITRALKPQQKSWPPIPLLLAGAAFVGLALGASGGLASEYMAPTVMSADQVRSIVGAPVIGVVPAGATPPKPLPAKRGREAPPPAPDEPNPARLDPVTQRVALLLLSRWGEADAGRRYAARSLVVTSAAADGAERARIARLIATAAARRGDHVLFVDAAGHESRSRGFLDLMRGECTYNSVMKPSEGGEYQVIAKGRAASAPRDSDRPREARIDAAGWQFTRAFRYFDLTVIDAGGFSDHFDLAPALSEIDDVLLVAEMGVTPHKALADLVEAGQLMGKAPTCALLVDKSLRA